MPQIDFEQAFRQLNAELKGEDWSATYYKENAKDILALLE